MAILMWILALGLVLAPRLAFGRDVDTEMRFPRPEHVVEDTEPLFPSRNKYKRWIRQEEYHEHHDVNMLSKVIHVKDLAFANKTMVLDQNGFEYITLNQDIMPIFSRIYVTGLDGARAGPTMVQTKVTEDAKENLALEEMLARSLQGPWAFQLTDSFVFNLRCAGFVIRKGGPMGIPLNGTGFDSVAQRVHIDLDIEGEPLTRMGVKWVFNQLPFMHVINVWVPLEKPRLRPLGLMDLNSLREDRILRYRAWSTKNAGGHIGSFSSDRLMPMYGDEQEWYWKSTMDFGQALVFYTGFTAHSSFSIPGEVYQRELLDHINAFLVHLEHPTQDTLDAVNALCESDAFHRIETESAASEMESFSRELIVETLELSRKLCGLSRIDNSTVEFAIVKQAQKNLSRASLEIRCASLIIPHNLLLPTLLLAFASLYASYKLCVFLVRSFASKTIAKVKQT